MGKVTHILNLILEYRTNIPMGAAMSATDYVARHFLLLNGVNQVATGGAKYSTFYAIVVGELSEEEPANLVSTSGKREQRG
jgi:hypothetical protein